ncbi:hypothetical protein [Nonomuraea sp. B19D2]|uniref:hypothetical protein n=1 Tax=Nonomuraea sp. B19D2 TaxID=3159561 RepID=UPI0032DBE5BD
MSYGDDCSAARDAQRAADDARHEVDMLSRTVDSNRWASENRDGALEGRLRELACQIGDLQGTIRELEQRLQAVVSR